MSNLSIQIQGQILALSQPVLQSETASAATTSTVPQPRLVKAAHEFEAAMMKELMAPLEPGHDQLGGDDGDSGSSSALGSFAGEALGKAISEHGGFGIAKNIIRQLTAGSNHSGNSPVPANRKPDATKEPFQ
jgi:flagellar protein FlgJ